MTDLVQLTKENGIAVITINNPPVNALSPGVPEGIARAIEEINNDAAVKACVLIGGGRTFVSGADIKEFSKMRSGATDLAPLVRGGFVPAFVDVESDTYNIDVERIEEMVTDRTAAIMVPNLIGNAPDWDRMRRLPTSTDSW